jgi:general secretion pathway protein D
MKDGETQILGGLIQDEDRVAADKVPGLGQLPILGRLFSNHNGDHKKTEIVLAITPHIVRPQRAPDADTRELWSGTEAKVRTEALRLDAPGAETASAPLTVPGAAASAVAISSGAASVVAVTPGNVGGGNGDSGGKAGGPASGAQGVPVTGALGVAPPTPRTTAPQAMFGGRFMTSVPVPATAGSAVDSGASGAVGGGGAANPGTPAGGAAPDGAAAGHAESTAPAAGSAAPAANAASAQSQEGATDTTSNAPAASAAHEPAQQSASPAPSPPPIMPVSPSDMASENPLHAIPVNSN